MSLHSFHKASSSSLEHLITTMKSEALKTGFKIVVKGGRREWKQYMCHRSGTYKPHRQNSNKRPETSAKIDCPWGFSARFLHGKEEWEINMRCSEHNHPLDLSAVPQKTTGDSSRGPGPSTSGSKQKRRVVTPPPPPPAASPSPSPLHVSKRPRKGLIESSDSEQNQEVPNAVVSTTPDSSDDGIELKPTISRNPVFQTSSTDQLFFTSEMITSVITKYVDSHFNPIGDGHCGFRAIAHVVKGDENKWPSVREDLMDEINGPNRPLYFELSGILFQESPRLIGQRLANFSSEVDEMFYLDAEKMGDLIANAYKRPFSFYSSTYSMVFFPSFVPPNPSPPINLCLVEHEGFAHFFSLSLKPGIYPVPQVGSHWEHLCNPVAKAWKKQYAEHMALGLKVGFEPNDFDKYFKLPSQLVE